MIEIEKIKEEIIERLKPLNPDMIILFGSYANGKPTEESDIDLYVVTGDNFMPSNFKEKMEIKLKFARAIDQIRDRYPVDLIVHTRPMSEIFVRLDSMFSREILTNGERLI